MHALKRPPAINEWIVFTYRPTALFCLKASRATSTVGKTLLVPTPYAVKMAFVDAALRHGLTDDPDALVRMLAQAQIRIGVPFHACVTGTIQRVRQETRPEDRKKDRSLPYYRTTIAMREVVSYSGPLSLAFDTAHCSAILIDILTRAAPAINYFGKRGSFMQYCGHGYVSELDESFTQCADALEPRRSLQQQVATLDDFGIGATFDALNSFSPTEMKRGIHRKFVETVVPYQVRNFGFSFVHYALRQQESNTPR